MPVKSAAAGNQRIGTALIGGKSKLDYSVACPEGIISRVRARHVNPQSEFTKSNELHTSGLELARIQGSGP